jgi:hypothetical protein
VYDMSDLSRVISSGEDMADAKLVMLHPGKTSVRYRANETDAETWAIIRSLRRMMSESLLQPRDDLGHACMMIVADPSTSIDRFAAAFFHGLGRYARRKLVFFPARALSVSQDELWLVSLLRALRKNDTASSRYLLESAIAPEGRRWLLFLADALARYLLAPDRPGEQP